MRLVRLLPAIFAVAVSVPAFALAQEGEGGGGGGRGGRRGGMGGFSMADQLKEAVDLTDEQVTKVKAIEEESRQEMQKARDAGERPNFQETMKKNLEKIKGILTDAQKPKFDEWQKKMEERFQNFGRMGGGGGRGGPRDPGERDKEMSDRAEKELTLSADEKAAVMPLVKKLIEARAEHRKNQDTRRKDLEKFLKDVPGTTDAQREEIAGKLKEIKKTREAEEAKIKEAEQALREVLTPENEAKCITIGIL